MTTPPVRTTTISVTQPENYESLSSQFKLVRYIVPDEFAKQAIPRARKFAQLHNGLKEQLTHPYKSYTNDMLDGFKRWVIYVLYPHKNSEGKDIEVQNLAIGITAMEYDLLDFKRIELHNLLKLLQIQYFYNEGNNKFVTKDECYIHAKRSNDLCSEGHICLHIELKGDIANRADQLTQIFKVIGTANTFCPVRHEKFEEGNENLYHYYAINMIKDNMTSFRQFRPDEARTSIQAKRPVYEWRTFEGRRTTLPYYSRNDIEHSRGYLLNNFIDGFKTYLTGNGFKVEHIQRIFERLTIPAELKQERADILPVHLLNNVYVYDNRLSNTHELNSYLTLFRQKFPNLNFEVIEDVLTHSGHPLLIIHDCDASAFKAKMPLANEPDPYQRLYRQIPLIPKQSFNVNFNEPDGLEREQYLNYPMIEFEKVADELEVSIYQLFLKSIVMQQLNVTNLLPLISTKYAFVRKVTYGVRRDEKVSYEVAMYFKNNQLRCINLGGAPEEREEFDVLLDEWGVDWIENYQNMLKKYKKLSDEGEPPKDLSSYDVIVGPGLFIEIEDLNERVLYEFDEILNRQQALETEISVDDFKLFHRYDEAKKSDMLTVDDLYLYGIIGKTKKRLTKIEQDSIKLYHQFREYDDLLEELKSFRSTISYEQLLRDEYWVPRIATIFNFEAGENGTYNTKQLREYYKNVGMFLGDRESDVVRTYQGIWYDDDMRYVVGDKNAIKYEQPRAHLVRRFDIYQGKQLDIQGLLAACSVQFVRLRQFTVYPYYFHLIDLYIDNVLKRSNTVPA